MTKKVFLIIVIFVMAKVNLTVAGSITQEWALGWDLRSVTPYTDDEGTASYPFGVTEDQIGILGGGIGISFKITEPWADNFTGETDAEVLGYTASIAYPSSDTVHFLGPNPPSHTASLFHLHYENGLLTELRGTLNIWLNPNLNQFWSFDSKNSTGELRWTACDPVYLDPYGTSPYSCASGSYFIGGEIVGVPEPSSAALLLTGLLAILVVVKKSLLVPR